LEIEGKPAARFGGAGFSQSCSGGLSVWFTLLLLALVWIECRLRKRMFRVLLRPFHHCRCRR
jgi:hypothetical protein